MGSVVVGSSSPMHIVLYVMYAADDTYIVSYLAQLCQVFTVDSSIITKY